MVQPKSVRVFAYEMFTPKFTGKSIENERYDHAQIEYLFKKLLTIPEANRAYIFENKVMCLESFSDSDDADFSEGCFVSSKFGEEKDVINVRSMKTTGKKGKDNGDKNYVHFLIEKNTGLLLIQSDTERVVTRKNFYNYIFNFIDFAKPYIYTFKRQNKPAEIIEKMFVRIVNIPAEDFFNEIQKFCSVKDAYILIDPGKKEGKQNPAAAFFSKKAKENNVSGVNMIKVSLLNQTRGSTLGHVSDFFKKLYESQKYDGFGVDGYIKPGTPKHISLDKVSSSHYVNTTINDKGQIDSSKLIIEMVDLAKKDDIVKKNKNDGFTVYNPVKVGIKNDRDSFTKDDRGAAGIS